MWNIDFKIMYLLYEILLLRSDTGLKPVIEFVNYYFYPAIPLNKIKA